MNAELQHALAVLLLSVGQYLTWRRVNAVRDELHREQQDPLVGDPP